ncbi:putative carbon-oxygen lyase [Dioscorea sansibarensis]
MALRLLRMHGYPISPDVLEYFKDDNGNFICLPGETHQGVSDMFNLYRFSQLSFPGERILRKAKAYAEEYLITCVHHNQMEDKWSVKKSLKEEVNLYQYYYIYIYTHTSNFFSLMSSTCSLMKDQPCSAKSVGKEPSKT